MEEEFLTSAEDASDSLTQMISTTLSEKIEDVDIDRRWNTKIRSIMNNLALMIVQFSMSKILNRETSKVQGFIHQVFRRTDAIEKVKKDIELQNAFLMGFFHAFDEFIILTTKELELHGDDNSLESVIKSYKHTTTVLLALDEEVELSHKELSERIGVSTTALSNYMNKVKIYRIFNSHIVGKNRYYSIAHPNGEDALKIVKNNERPAVETYTQFLLNLLESLYEVGFRDELDENYVLNKCSTLVTKYTSSPATCVKQITALTHLLMSERMTVVSLVEFEGSPAVEKNVYIFTRNVRSKEYFRETIRKNIDKGIYYHWFLSSSDTKEDAEEYLHQQLNKKIRITSIPNRVFDKVVDAVIYDGKKGFQCLDETIDLNTPYISMTAERISELMQFADKSI